jgi:CHAD domain-containing protein
MSLLEKRNKELFEGLARTIARPALEVSPRSVHRLRLTIRKLESLVAFAHPDLGRKQRRALEDLVELRKRAGKVRNLDVQMDLLGTIANGSTARDRRKLTDLLERKRIRRAKHLRAHIKSLQDSKFLGHLDRVVADAAGKFHEGALSPLTEARRQLTSLAMEYGTGDSVQPRLLHQVRIRLKMIRYLAESSAESPEQQRILISLKAVQDAIGSWQDWEELRGTAEKLFDERVNCPLLMEIRALRAARYAAATAAVAILFSTDSSARERKQHPGAGATALARPA